MLFREQVVCHQQCLDSMEIIHFFETHSASLHSNCVFGKQPILHLSGTARFQGKIKQTNPEAPTHEKIVFRPFSRLLLHNTFTFELAVCACVFVNYSNSCFIHVVYLPWFQNEVYPSIQCSSLSEEFTNCVRISTNCSGVQ